MLTSYFCNQTLGCNSIWYVKHSACYLKKLHKGFIFQNLYELVKGTICLTIEGLKLFVCEINNFAMHVHTINVFKWTWTEMVCLGN